MKKEFGLMYKSLKLLKSLFTSDRNDSKFSGDETYLWKTLLFVFCITANKALSDDISSLRKLKCSIDSVIIGVLCSTELSK